MPEPGNGAGTRRGRPPITVEQRAMAVALLANAIRKEERFRAGEGPIGDDLALAAGAGRRAEAASRYVRGMRDLLAVLFDDGRNVADGCYEAAREQARGERPPP